MRHPKLHRRLVAGGLVLLGLYVAANLGFYFTRSVRAYRSELLAVSDDMVSRVRDAYDTVIADTIRAVLVSTDQDGPFREALLTYDGSYADRVAILQGLNQIQSSIEPATSVYASLAPEHRVFSLETGGFYPEDGFYDGTAVRLMNRVGSVIVEHDRQFVHYGTYRSYTTVAVRVRSPMAHAAVVVNMEDAELRQALLNRTPGAAEYELQIVGAEELEAQRSRENQSPISGDIRAYAESDSFGRGFILDLGAGDITDALRAAGSFAAISLGAAAVLFAGFALFVGRSLRPLDRIMATAGLTGTERDPPDMSALESYLSRLMEDNNRLQHDYQRLLPESRKELLRDLFTGSLTIGESLRERLVFNGIDEPSAGLVAACLQLETQDVGERRRLEANVVVEEVLSNRLDGAHRGFHVRTGRNQYGLALPLFSSPDRSAQVFEETLADMPEVIRSRVTIGIGRPCDGFQTLSRSFTEAQSALEYRMTLGRQVLSIDAVESLRGRRYRYPYQRERVLIEHLQAGDEEQSITVLNEMLDQLVAERLGDREFEYLRLQLVHALNRYLFEHGITIEDEERLNREYDTTTARSVDEVREILTNIVHRISVAQQEHRTASRKEMVDKFVACIQQSYQDPGFQLLDIEEAFGLNRYYIGQLISEHTGRHFNDHLNDARVRAGAAILEAEPQTPVKEVAGRVGYAYPYYFIRQFKRVFGVTPKVYRDRR